MKDFLTSCLNSFPINPNYRSLSIEPVINHAEAEGLKWLNEIEWPDLSEQLLSLAYSSVDYLSSEALLYFLPGVMSLSIRHGNRNFEICYAIESRFEEILFNNAQTSEKKGNSPWMNFSSAQVELIEEWVTWMKEGDSPFDLWSELSVERFFAKLNSKTLD